MQKYWLVCELPVLWSSKKGRLTHVSIVQMEWYNKMFLKSLFYDCSTASFLMFSFTISDSLVSSLDTGVYLQGNAFIVIQSVTAVNVPLLFWQSVPWRSDVSTLVRYRRLKMWKMGPQQQSKWCFLSHFHILISAFWIRYNYTNVI